MCVHKCLWCMRSFGRPCRACSARAQLDRMGEIVKRLAPLCGLSAVCVIVTKSVSAFVVVVFLRPRCIHISTN